VTSCHGAGVVTGDCAEVGVSRGELMGVRVGTRGGAIGVEGGSGVLEGAIVGAASLVGGKVGDAESTRF
jgi:hypothetical protein